MTVLIETMTMTESNPVHNSELSPLRTGSNTVHATMLAVEHAHYLISVFPTFVVKSHCGCRLCIVVDIVWLMFLFRLLSTAPTEQWTETVLLLVVLVVVVV